MDSQVPLAAPFKDENGKAVTLAKYLGDKPVMLILISYTCTQICTAQFQALHPALSELPFTVGKDFDIVTVSIDPRETPVMATAHKQENVKNYEKAGRKNSADGWHFLTGSESSIKALTGSIGFRYAYNPATKEYVHPDGVILLTPQGHVSRYFYRLEYPTLDMKFGLMDASKGAIGSPLDKLAQTCFHYNSTTGKYEVVITRIIKLAGIATVLGLVLGVGLMLRSEKKRGGDLKPQSV
jgi:protein SCO1/2